MLARAARAARAAPAAPPRDAAAVPVPAPAAPPAPERRCPYCCGRLAHEARKCGGCGEWLVRTSAGPSAALLRLLGWLWIGVSVVAAAGIWSVGSAARLWLLVRSMDPAVTPAVLDLVLYGLVGAVLLQGLTVGAALRVLAALAPRRPRWWS